MTRPRAHTARWRRAGGAARQIGTAPAGLEAGDGNADETKTNEEKNRSEEYSVEALAALRCHLERGASFVHRGRSTPNDRDPDGCEKQAEEEACERLRPVVEQHGDSLS